MCIYTHTHIYMYMCEGSYHIPSQLIMSTMAYFQMRSGSEFLRIRTLTYLFWGHISIHNSVLNHCLIVDGPPYCFQVKSMHICVTAGQVPRREFLGEEYVHLSSSSY
jgi:hypothetical protein